jgi:hypothetical protein
VNAQQQHGDVTVNECVEGYETENMVKLTRPNLNVNVERARMYTLAAEVNMHQCQSPRLPRAVASDDRNFVANLSLVHSRVIELGCIQLRYTNLFCLASSFFD